MARQRPATDLFYGATMALADLRRAAMQSTIKQSSLPLQEQHHHSVFHHMIKTANKIKSLKVLKMPTMTSTMPW
jgi:hypothetical protein